MNLDERVIVIGGGGHAHVVVDTVAQNRYRCSLRAVAILDKAPGKVGETISGIRIVGVESDLDTIEHDSVLLAIGDNSTRKRIFDRLQSEGERFAIAVHPTSTLAKDIEIGPGTVCCAGSTINPAVKVMEDVIVNTNASIDHHCIVEPHVHIAPGVQIGGDCQIGEGALIGIGATVLPGVEVGAGAIVGGGAVVIRPVDPGSVVVGNPARTIE